MEDTADIFDSSLSALFAVPPIGFSTSSPSDPWTYTPPDTANASSSSSSPNPSLSSAVKLWLPHPPASLYAALQANNLWLSAVYLADALTTGALTLAAPVVELGAGAGLPSIIAARAGHNVVCTDYDDGEVIRTIRRNFSYNVGGTEVGTTGEGGVAARAGAGAWAVRGHTWGTDAAPLLSLASDMGSSGFDLILADTLWSSEGHAALLRSVLALLRVGGTAHVAAGLHTGRGPVERFMASASDAGLRVEKHAEVRWKPEGGWAEYDGQGEGEGEVRGVVVYFTLRR